MTFSLEKNVVAYDAGETIGGVVAESSEKGG